VILKNRNLFSHGFGGRTSKVNVLEELGSGDASLPGLWMTAFSLCFYMTFVLCAYSNGVFSSYYDARLSS
jgi:hypothetical protein